MLGWLQVLPDAVSLLLQAPVIEQTCDVVRSAAWPCSSSVSHPHGARVGRHTRRREERVRSTERCMRRSRVKGDRSETANFAVVYPGMDGPDCQGPPRGSCHVFLQLCVDTKQCLLSVPHGEHWRSVRLLDGRLPMQPRPRSVGAASWHGDHVSLAGAEPVMCVSSRFGTNNPRPSLCVLTFAHGGARTMNPATSQPRRRPNL